jgi:hypothetical protein
MDLYSDRQFASVHFSVPDNKVGEGGEQSLPFIMLVKLYELCSLSSSLCMHTRMYNSKIERSASKFSLH